MRKPLSVGDLREYAKLFKIMFIAWVALFAVTVTWVSLSWSTTPELARQTNAILVAIMGFGLILSWKWRVWSRRQLENLAKTRN